ncbi:hypothetical protein KFL_000030150 [Klebsormidium nitens]|uniref:Glycosyltransferase family 61 protein n=1 Tax=Klebsormidium nitens TaxID=105231 RepID=A0A1Y1HMA7_KLENI|nr:hypothetical protein KFL_000030150 [Klebsormidium nitens]|eukprot:GAQ77736.1 hypothetical protein KFL_000030150 [Klebsormidium nitens]
MQPSRFGRRRLASSEMCPSFRSTILSCFRLLYFRVLASRIPSVLLGTSALLVTAFCTEIFQLSIPIGYPYSRERHLQDGASSSVGLQMPFEGSLAERAYKATSDAVHLSANASMDKDQGQKGPISPPYVWEEQRVCGAVPNEVDGSRITFKACKRHHPVRDQLGGNAPVNPRSALDPRNFQSRASKESSSGAGVPLCPVKPSAVCFSRVRGGRVCLRQDKVGLCVNDAGAEALSDGALTLPVTVAKCQRRTVDKVDNSCKQAGLAFIADDRLSMPDPLEESERLIPALLLSKLNIPAKFQDWPTGRPQVFWFKEPATVSVWTQGLLKALNISSRWRDTLHQGQESGVASEHAAKGEGLECDQGGTSEARNGIVHLQFLQVEGGATLAEKNESAGSPTFVTHENLHEGWDRGERVVNVSRSKEVVQAGVVRLDIAQGVFTTVEVGMEDRARAPSSRGDAESDTADFNSSHYNASSILDEGLKLYSNEAEAPLWNSKIEEKGLLENKGEGLLEETPFLNFLSAPGEGAPAVCFDDAVLLTSHTNGAIIPNNAANDWLRSQVLQYCGVKEELAPKVVKTAVILEPPGGQGSLINKAELARLLTDIVGLEVAQKRIEGTAFCDQVRAIASEDFLVVPHGPLNVNLIFAKPGAIVMEVFPYLYYTNFIGNYIHAARLTHLQVLGSGPPWSPLLWIYSWLGWDTCHSVRACRDHARRQNIHVDTREFETMLWQLVNDCVIVGEASPAKCRT